MRLLALIICFSISAVQAETIADPMQPPAYALFKIKQNKLKVGHVKKVVKSKIVQNELKLQSVLISKQRKIAMINDKLLGLGDSINGAKLIKISKNKVRLIKKGKVIDLIVNTNQSIITITRSKQSK